MFDTGVRQFRLAMGMVWGYRLDPANIERLVEDAIRTITEFGEPGDDVQDLTDGPLTDPEAQLHFANTGLRRTAKRLAKQSRSTAAGSPRPRWTRPSWAWSSWPRCR